MRTKYTLGLLVLCLITLSSCQSDEDGHTTEEDYEDYDDYTDSTTKRPTTTTTKKITTTTEEIVFVDLDDEQPKYECPTDCQCSVGTTFINCSNRDLTSVPKNIPNDAIDLDLSYNKLENLNFDDFKNCSQLRNLILKGNRITTFDKNIFQSTFKLNFIDLSENLLTTIDSDIFSEATELTKLNLNSNELNLPEFGSFLHLTDLEELNMIGCNITELHDETFSNLSGLISLNLSDNPLGEVEINTKAFEPLVNLQKLQTPVIARESVQELCTVLKAIDVIYTPRFNISCYEYTSGSDFEDSIITTKPITANPNGRSNNMDIESPEIVAQKPTDQTLSDTPHIDKPKEQKPPIIDEPLRNKTSELEGLDMSNLPKVEETKLENSNATKKAEKIGISSQNINNILIAIIVIAIAGLTIGVIFRRDCFGIKTKLCRRSRRPAPTDQVRPAEEVPLNKV